MSRVLTRLPASALVLAGALSACSEGSGTLALTVDAVPTLVRDSAIFVRGSITRTPAKVTDLIVTASGGATPATDTLQGNRYEVRVRLNVNAVNDLTISATDATGSSSNSLSVSLRQDGQGPVITQSTPADTSDNVALGTPVSLRFSEPVVLGAGGGIRLTRQGAAIPGTTTRSVDSLTLTFAPTGPLDPNAIYRIGVSGVSDVAANNAPATTATCFVTTIAGSDAVATFPDSTVDWFHGPPGVAPGSSGLLSPDLIAARFGRDGPLLTGVLRFVGPRVFSPTVNNQATALVEFDIDEDSTTGFKTQKDQLFDPAPTLGPTYSSGMGAEYLLGLEPHPQLGDSAYLGRYVSNEQFQPLALFLPGYCGAFMGFVLPFDTDLLDDDGKMHMLVLSISSNALELFVDPIPTTKNLAVDLRLPGPAPVYSGAPLVSPPGLPRVRRLPTRIPLR